MIEHCSEIVNRNLFKHRDGADQVEILERKLMEGVCIVAAGRGKTVNEDQKNCPGFPQASCILLWTARSF